MKNPLTLGQTSADDAVAGPSGMRASTAVDLSRWWRRMLGIRWLWAGVVLVPVMIALHAADHGPHDLDVYRTGARVFLGREPGPLYAIDNPRLAYTYPPATVLLFVPFAVVPPLVATHVARALLGFSLAALVSMSLRIAGHRVAWWQYLLITVACGLTTPVVIDLRQGQVSLVVVLMIVADLAGPVPTRHRGWLTGLAAGIKLTPLAFLVFLAVTRQWGALVRCCAAFAASVALGFALMPHVAARYWTSDLFDSRRVGKPWNAANESIRGAFYRLGAENAASGRWLLDLVIVVACVAAYAVARMLWRRDERLLAVVVAAFAGLYASPISWIHHWAWAVPLLVALWRVSRVLVAGAGAVFLLSEPVVRGLDWTRQSADWSLGQNLLGDDYLWLSFILLAALALWCRRLPVVRPDDAVERAGVARV